MRPRPSFIAATRGAAAAADGHSDKRAAWHLDGAATDVPEKVPVEGGWGLAKVGARGGGWSSQ